MPSFGSHYDTLGLDRGATESQIKSAYRKLALKHHPDKSRDPASTEIFQAAQAAYECLTDPDKREEYDNPSRPPQDYAAHDSDRYTSRHGSTSPSTVRNSHSGFDRAAPSHWAAGQRSRPAANARASYHVFPAPVDEMYSPRYRQYSHHDIHSHRGTADAEYEMRYPPSYRSHYEPGIRSPRPSSWGRQNETRAFSRTADSYYPVDAYSLRERGFYPDSTFHRTYVPQYDDFEEESRQLRDNGRSVRGPHYNYNYYDDFDTWDASAPRVAESGYHHYQQARQRQQFQRVQVRETHTRMANYQSGYDIPYRHSSGHYGHPAYTRFYGMR